MNKTEMDITILELLEEYLKSTDLTVKELVDRNALVQIRQFATACHIELSRKGQ